MKKVVLSDIVHIFACNLFKTGMKYFYKTEGTCSTNIELEIDGGVLREVRFWGGCNGNLQGISRLVQGMQVSEVLNRLEGIRCGARPTSCPDQLCQALRAIEAHEKGTVKVGEQV